MSEESEMKVYVDEQETEQERIASRLVAAAATIYSGYAANPDVDADPDKLIRTAFKRAVQLEDFAWDYIFNGREP